jgi:lysophospholipase L1-like esterase
VVILMAGINNLGMDAKLSSDDLADGIKRIISTLQSKAPNSKLLLLSLLPTGEPESDLRKRILATNKVLSTLGDEKTLFYLDLHDSYLDSNNRFPDALTPDGLHLNAKGYQIWADKMRPALSRILEMK